MTTNYQHTEDKSAKPTSNYCGTCKTDPCRADDGIDCCHDYVRYGHCSHHPLEQSEETWDDVIERNEEDSASSDETSIPETPRREQRPRDLPRPLSQDRGYRPPRPARR